ncbi:MAG: type II toxin-antitoxin system death-on-curing family toxin [Patescibacteria group bacterium]
MRYLTVEDVLLLHHLAVEQSGGVHGLRSSELLDSAVHRCQASFGGADLYPTLFLKAAGLMHSLIKNHPFVDGNKRTGIYSAMTFLEINHYHLKAGQEEVVRFALSVDLENPELDKIAAWLKAHSRKISHRKT